MTNSPAAIPRAVLAATILWLVYGAIGLLAGVVTLAAGAGAYAQILFGLVFLITGVQVMMGRASSLLASGIVCIILGAISLLVTLPLLAATKLGLPMWAVTASIVNASLLIASGVLAIVGNRAFKAWRVARGLARQTAPTTPAPPNGCPTCGGPMRFAGERGAWVCDRCSAAH